MRDLLGEVDGLTTAAVAAAVWVVVPEQGPLRVLGPNPVVLREGEPLPFLRGGERIVCLKN